MDLEALVTDELRDDMGSYSLLWFDVEASSRRPPHARVGVRLPDGTESEGTFTGDGPIDAVFRAINAAAGREAKLREFRVDAVTGGQDALGETSVVLELGDVTGLGPGRLDRHHRGRRAAPTCARSPTPSAAARRPSARPRPRWPRPPPTERAFKHRGGGRRGRRRRMVSGMPTGAAASTTRPAALDEPTLCAAFARTAAERGDAVALRTPGDGVASPGASTPSECAAIAAGLAALGVGRGDTVAIMLTNRPEFHVVDCAAMHLGAVPFSIYNTSSPEQTRVPARRRRQPRRDLRAGVPGPGARGARPPAPRSST